MNTAKIIDKILRSFDDKVLSIKTEMFRVDTQNSYYELTIDSEETTKHVFITINGRLKNAISKLPTRQFTLNPCAVRVWVISKLPTRQFTVSKLAVSLM